MRYFYFDFQTCYFYVQYKLGMKKKKTKSQSVAFSNKCAADIKIYIACITQQRIQNNNLDNLFRRVT